jgi:uroporphyrinogen-III decarboxylase
MALNPKKHIQITLAALGRNIKLPRGNMPSLNELITKEAQITQAVKLKTNVKKETLRKSKNLLR